MVLARIGLEQEREGIWAPVARDRPLGGPSAGVIEPEHGHAEHRAEVGVAAGLPKEPRIDQILPRHGRLTVAASPPLESATEPPPLTARYSATE